MAIVHCPRLTTPGLASVTAGVAGRGDLQHGQVRARIGADHDRGVDLAIVGRHPELLGLADDVLVGEDVAVGVDEEAGADRSGGLAQDGIELLRVEALGAEGLVGIDRRCRKRRWRRRTGRRDRRRRRIAIGGRSGRGCWRPGRQTFPPAANPPRRRKRPPEQIGRQQTSTTAASPRPPRANVQRCHEQTPLRAACLRTAVLTSAPAHSPIREPHTPAHCLSPARVQHQCNRQTRQLGLLILPDESAFFATVLPLEN